MNFKYHLPVEIVFGFGESLKLRENLPGLSGRCFIIADRFITNTPYFKETKSHIAELIAGQWDKVEPNPSTDSVNEAADAGRLLEPDIIIAVGGGSCMDTAKAVSLSIAGGRRIEDYHSGGVEYPRSVLPIIAIPTTAGTGSEVTPISVLKDKSKNKKAPIAAPCLYPSVAIVDPEWTMTMPAELTAATGLDALSHAIEGFWSKGAFPVCDCYALRAARLIFNSLEKAIIDGSDSEARESMALASILAGMAFGQPKNAAVHACSFPLSTHFQMSHGVACAFTLDYFVRLNSEAIKERLTEMATYCGFDDIGNMADKIAELKKIGGLPRTFSEAGFNDIEIDKLVAESFHPLINNNPREITEKDLYKMYESLK